MVERENKFLNKIKTNIISWYCFKEDSTILIIGENTQEYCDYLEKKGKKVFIENDNNIKELYDYIIIFDKVDFIKSAKKYLKPDGIILLITNNKLGIRNFSILGAFEELINDSVNQYSKKQIENVLKENGYDNYKFYYPLPDYKIANVIFSDDYLPEYNNTKLMNNYCYPDDVKILFRENEVLKEVTRSGEFTTFTNSYFVEINNKSKEKFIGFNNVRKEEYRLITKIYDDYVIKEEISVESKKHIENMRNIIDILNRCGIKTLDLNKNSKIYSQYVSEKTLYQELVECIFNNEINKAIGILKEYYEFLKEKFKNEKTEEINSNIFENVENIKELYNVKNGLMDLVFENIFKIDGEYVTFDQEWNIENIPLEFILYRAINNVYIYNPEVEINLPKQQVYNTFGLEKYILDFQIAESNIQKIIIDSEKVKIYNASQKEKYINILKEKIRSLEENKNEKRDVIIALEKTIEEKDEYVNSLNKNIEDHKNHIGRLEEALAQKDSIIGNLNENVNQKQMTIDYYENMKVVKLMKKIKK